MFPLHTTLSPLRFFAALFLSLFAYSVAAVPITGLFATGVDGSGTVLGDGATDSHYEILAPSQQGVVINQANIPSSWVPNNATSRWIWQQADGQPTFTTLTFRTTFDLTGLDAATAELAGTWSTDNFGLDILINGSSTGQTCAGFTAFCDFDVTSGFTAGVNTLDFVVQDAGFISGFRVGSLAGAADPAARPNPEPAVLTLLLFGLTAVWLGARSKI